ncbi:glucan phosphoethanolaminetransferase (alkaline phosphatase superfamily) [Salibacterium salarium]|uniref:hypothetical protein n=1 Tax=Salibacterium salarium TaxID=284579 RepID=UPI002786B88C|nr:hypothetical protein [Salibacterium salarium]MDQ0297737.1 glucan phosphoethanolaminetransferase (alkaline phosphatase superfamily) [Salibacterium salarium]
MKGKMFLLITYWILIIIGLASYYYAFIEYGFGVTVMITFVSGLGAILIANAIKNRFLIILGVFLFVSSFIFIGIIALIEII